MRVLATAAVLSFGLAAQIPAVAAQESPAVVADPAETSRQNTNAPTLRPDILPTKPMEETPLKYELPPEKLEYMERAQREVEELGNAIQLYREQLAPGAVRPDVQKLHREWHKLTEAWELLRQSRGANWETSREKFELLYSDVVDQWQQVRGRS